MKSELRIGNYIKVDDLPIEQVTLDVFATLKEFPATIGCFAGVPITEEWLLKLGFRTVSGLFALNLEKDLTGKVLAISLNDFSYGIYSSNFDFGVGNGFNSGFHRIKYIHQLQNLYFALTGEELIIKE